MTERLYSWADGYRPRVGRKAIPAEVAAAEIERIERQNDGKVTPRLVVEASSPDDAVLHEMFEWDDAKAADTFRLRQASVMMSSIRVVIKEQERPVPSRVSIKPLGSAEDVHENHISIVTVRDSPDQRTQFLLRELTRIQSILQRTEGFDEMDPIRASCRVVRRRLEEQQSSAFAAD